MVKGWLFSVRNTSFMQKKNIKKKLTQVAKGKKRKKEIKKRKKTACY